MNSIWLRSVSIATPPRGLAVPAVHPWLSEPDPVQPQARAGGRGQCGTDVADRPTGATIGTFDVGLNSSRKSKPIHQQLVDDGCNERIGATAALKCHVSKSHGCLPCAMESLAPPTLGSAAQVQIKVPLPTTCKRPVPQPGWHPKSCGCWPRSACSSAGSTRSCRH